MEIIDLRTFDGADAGVVCAGEGKFPRLAQYADGALFVAGHRGFHYLSYEGNSLQGFVSDDGGRSWSAPLPMCERDGVDPRSPAVGVGPDGILYAGWKELRSADPTDSRILFHRSADRGASWERRAEVPIPEPDRRGHTYGKLLFEDDGTILMNVYTYVPGRKEMDARIYAGRDGGTTWTRRGLIGEGLNETSLYRRADGDLLAFARTADEEERVRCMRSDDGGRSWRQEALVTSAKEIPAECVSLGDGLVVCFFGRRHAPCGVRARVSDDDGLTWREDLEILVDDGCPDFDCGYPTATVVDDHLLVLWYVNNDHAAPDRVAAERRCLRLRCPVDALRAALSASQDGCS